MAIRVIICCCVLGTAACDRQQLSHPELREVEPPPQMDVPTEHGPITALTTAELEEVLVGAAIIDGHVIQSFCEDGGLQVSGTRAPYVTSYDIHDDLVCIANGTGRCFRIYRQGEAYYTQNPPGTSSLSPVIVHRRAEGIGC